MHIGDIIVICSDTAKVIGIVQETLATACLFLRRKTLDPARSE
jgi:hypothetical protein